MADRYWVGGSGNWDATSTANWATSSGGTAGASAPTSADNVIFDANSNVGTGAFTVTVAGTIGSPALCRDFSTGGAGGALDGTMTLAITNSANYLDIYGSLTIPATNFTANMTAGLLRFRATTTGKTITTNGVTLGTGTQIVFDGVGGEWTLGSAFTAATATSITITNGSFVTANYNVTASLFQSSNTNTRSLSLGSSTITVSRTGGESWNTATTTNLTFNAGTSTITCSGASPTFNGGGLTFYNVSFTSAGNGQTTITGVNTFNNLTQTSRSATGRRLMVIGANQTVSGTLTLGAANTAIRRIIVTSDVVGTQRTITLNGTLATLADVDFQDIATAGTVGTWTGTRLGNGLGNSGITFDAPKTVYWNLSGSQSWSSTGWATTNNGTPAANNFPLAQDTAVFTEAGAAGTINIDSAWFIGEINMADGVSNRTTAMTLTFNTAAQIAIFKNVKLFSNLTISGTSGVPVFSVQGTTQTFTSAGVTFSTQISIVCPTGTVQLLDNLTCTNTVNLNQGTLDLNDFDLTCNIFSSSNSNTRSIDFGTGEINITGNAATIIVASTVTNFSYAGTPTVNCTYAGSTGTRTITFGNVSGHSEAIALNINITAGSDSVSPISGFKNLNFTGFSGTFTSPSGVTIYGNLILSATTTVASVTSAIVFAATSGTQQITTNGITIDRPITHGSTGLAATLQLQDNLTMGSTRTFTLTAGTLDLSSGNRTLSCGLFSSSNSNTRSIAFGTGNITITGNNAAIWNMGTATGFTYTGTPTVNCTYSGSTGSRTLSGGNVVTGGGTEFNCVSFNITAGTDTIVLSSSNAIKNIDFTGFAGTRTNTSATIFGNCVISSGMTLTAGANALTFAATSGTQEVTTNGVTLDFPITINGVGGTVELQDALTMGSTRTLTLTNGTLNANNYNVTTGLFSSSNSNTRTLTMGSGTWTIQGTGTAWDLSTTTGLTFNRGTSTISMTNGTSQTFAGGGLTYYKLNQGGLALTITGANTFFDITNTVQPTTITFPASTTTTFNNFSLAGTSGNLVTINSSSAGTQATLLYTP